MTDLLVEQRRIEALTVACEYCHADIGDRCVNPKTGELIEHQAAHLVRLTSSPREDIDNRRTLPGAPNGAEETR